MPDVELVSQIDALTWEAFSGDCFRNHGSGYGPLDSGGSRIHGGRWNPPESFPVIYLALSLETAFAEFIRTVERQGLKAADLLPRSVTTVEVVLSRVLNLTDHASLKVAGLDQAAMLGVDTSLSRDIGEAAHYLGLEGIRSPSATGTGEVLAIFWDKLLAGSKVVPGETISWTSIP